MKTENITLSGTVIDSSKGILVVSYKIPNCDLIFKANCRLSGGMKRNKIRVVLGDNVNFEISPYDGDDIKKGFITRRL